MDAKLASIQDIKGKTFDYIIIGGFSSKARFFRSNGRLSSGGGVSFGSTVTGIH